MRSSAPTVPVLGRRGSPHPGRQSSILRDAWQIEVVPLTLIDPRFYHLDTCFAPLAGGFVMYFPEAFDTGSRARIEAFYPPAKRIVVEEADAVRFACNVVNLDHTLILNHIGHNLERGSKPLASRSSNSTSASSSRPAAPPSAS